MARLGFNLVGYELGSRFPYQSHSECRQPGAVWTREQVQRLVTLAKARGITPIPCLNAIGHADRAPLVCLLPGKRWQYRVMDLTAPQFYPTFFDLLDELVAAFDSPPYVHLGTDECREALIRLSQLRSKPPEALYAEFVNRVTDHLRKKGVRAEFWSDMLLDPSVYPGEPANASPECPTDKALDALDRGAIIDYWCYSPSPYRGLDLFRQKGFAVWVSPWYDREGVPRLCWQAHQVGAEAVFGTTWTDASRVGDGLVLAAEYAWNAAKAGRYAGCAPWAVANELYCARPRWGPPEARPAQVTGGEALPDSARQSLIDAGLPLSRTLQTRGLQFDLTNPRFFGGDLPRRLAAPADILAAARNGDRLFVSLGPGRVWAVDGVNTDRGRAQTILYVAEPARESTGTNRWGCEWVVRNGRVVETASGQRCATSLNGSVAVPGFHQLRWHYSPKRGQGWRLWPAWFQYDADNPAIVLAYEWTTIEEDDPGRALRLRVTPAGRMLGVTLLGVSTW